MFLRHNIAGILWAIFIFILCSLPGYTIPHYRWTDLLSIDKAVHAFLFGILTFLLIRGFKKQTEFPFLHLHTLVIVFMISASYGGLLELMQNYCFIDRTGSWFDFIANTTGSLIAIALNSYSNRKTLMG
jgi:VanZ family protein